LTTQNKADDEGTALYFFISRKSETAACLAKDGNVNVSYSHPGDDRYVSVSGHATLAEDQTQKTIFLHHWPKPGSPAAQPTQLLLYCKSTLAMLNTGM